MKRATSLSLLLCLCPKRKGRRAKGRRCGVKLRFPRLAPAIQNIYSTHLTLGRSNYSSLTAKKEVRNFKRTLSVLEFIPFL